MTTDLSMCANEACNMKEKCYRYMAEPNPHLQAYYEWNRPRDYCFAEIEEGDRVRTVK